MCKDLSKCDDDIRKYGVVQLDENNRIMEFEEKPLEPNGKIISTGVYIIRRRLLIELLEEIANDERYDLVHDLISRYRKKKKIYAYLHESYFSCINSLEAYYDSNMNFLTKKTTEITFLDKILMWFPRFKMNRQQSTIMALLCMIPWFQQGVLLMEK